MSAMASQITGVSSVLLNRLFRRRSKKTSKVHVTGLCEGNLPVTGDLQHKRPVTRKIPFDDVIMFILLARSIVVLVISPILF